MPPLPENLLAELLTQARGLSPDVAATGFGVGLLLWLFGWRFHRFWIVLGITVWAGIVGLVSGKESGLQVLATGLLLALVAGLLALHVARILAVGGAGLAVMTSIDALSPNFQQPLLCFLLGGLLGVVLFRLLTMMMTSFAGVALMLSSGLLIFEKVRPGFDGVAWVNGHGKDLVWVAGGATLLGVVAQNLVERWRAGKKKGGDKPAGKKKGGPPRSAGKPGGHHADEAA
jgi:hypothetical protein